MSSWRNACQAEREIVQALLTCPPGPGAGASCTVNWMPGGRAEDVEPSALMASYAVSCTVGRTLMSVPRSYRLDLAAQLICNILSRGVLREWSDNQSPVINAQSHGTGFSQFLTLHNGHVCTIRCSWGAWSVSPAKPHSKLMIRHASNPPPSQPIT